MKKDILGYVIRKLRKYRLKFEQFRSGIIMRVSLKIRGVKLGKGCIFNGLASFSRYPESRIELGGSTRFASSSKYNLAGIYRKTTISTLRKGAVLKIGKNCGLSGTVIGAANNIDIGDNVLCGANVFISDFDWHNIHPQKRRIPCNSSAPVQIGNNVWLGLNSSVLKGVRIGENTIIGANSVVTKDIPANVIAAGNPCKVIKQL
ncbi:acyltransferase [Labilibacter marinus]|uniref:acyltransferase n=1 Tax=Labilibacter marinus TaxID=1477105 RepID=UPI0009FAE248|nr:acyltransferase [Labilibacter marinus]